MAKKSDLPAVINPDFSYVSAKDGKTYTMTLKEKTFADGYLDFGGNGTQAALKAFKCKNALVASAVAYEYLRKPHIMAYLNSKLEEAGFNDDEVYKQHLFLLNQHADLKTKAKAVELYYRRKGLLKDGSGGNKTLVIMVTPESASRYGVQPTHHTETSSA